MHKNKGNLLGSMDTINDADYFNQKMKDAKDISAAAVLLSALTAFIIGVLFLCIPLVRKILEII